MNFKNNKKGFTLIELIVVIAIIAILAAVAAPLSINQIKKSKLNLAIANGNTVLKYKDFKFSVDKEDNLTFDVGVFDENSAVPIKKGFEPLKENSIVIDIGQNNTFVKMYSTYDKVVAVWTIDTQKWVEYKDKI